MAVLLILAFWLLVKVLKFQTGNYFSDLYSQLQLSNLWLRGEPLFFENRYGSNLGLHNYFFSPIMALFTFFTGAYGIFIFHILSLLLAAAAWLRFAIRTADVKEKAILWVFIFALLLGPFSYWLWDNRPFGWHAELLYIPFGVLLAYTLRTKIKWATILLSASIILIREDGIIVVWAIASLYLVALGEFHIHKAFFKKWFPLTVLSLVLFLTGIGILQYFGGDHSRLSEVFGNRMLAPEEVSQWVVGELAKTLIFLLPVWLSIFIFRGWRMLTATLVVLLPLFFSGMISGFWYYPDGYYALLWQPRMSAILVVAFAGLILSEDKTYLSLKKSVAAGMIVSLWLLQYWLLKEIRNHDLIVMIKEPIVEWQTNRHLQENRIAIELSNKIPVETTVALPYRYFHIFHRHKIAWPDLPHNNRQQPEIIIYQNQDIALSNQFADGYDSTSYPPFNLKIRSNSRLKDVLK